MRPSHDDPEQKPKKFQRKVRSFMRRQGRMSDRQKIALHSLLPRFGIEFTPQLLNLDLYFGRSVPKVLEIGFGMGQSLARLADDHPDMDFLGIEVHEPGVGSLLATMQEQHIANIRVMCHDAVEILQYCIADNSLTAVNIFFPDPWPKKRHHKRRLIQTKFVDILVSKMTPHAQLHIATDWQPYAQWIEAILTAHPMLALSNNPPMFPRTTTKFEQRGIKLGHDVYEFLYIKTQ